MQRCAVTKNYLTLFSLFRVRLLPLRYKGLCSNVSSRRLKMPQHGSSSGFVGTITSPMCLSASTGCECRHTTLQKQQRSISVWAEFKQSVIDKAINQWQPRLRACVRASRQHFERLINRNNCLSVERFCFYKDTFSCELRI